MESLASAKMEDCPFHQFIFLNPSLTIIPNNAFRNCSTISAQILIPRHIEVIGENAFAGSSVHEVLFEQGSKLRNILSGAFEGCRDLKLVKFNSQLSKTKSKVLIRPAKTWWNQSMSQLNQISSKAFFGCISLQSIRLPASLSVIDERAFADSGLIHVWFESKLHLPTLKACAFQNCQHLQSLHVFDTVANLLRLKKEEAITGFFPPDSPFVGCRSLFSKCNLSITHHEPKIQSTTPEHTVSDASFKKYLETNFFYPFRHLCISSNHTRHDRLSCSTLFVAKQLTGTVFPMSTSQQETRFIFSYRQYKSQSLNSVDPKNIPFFERAHANSFIIPSSVLKVSTFDGSLDEVYFSRDSRVKEISASAFWLNKQLRSITIPATVLRIGTKAFMESTLHELSWARHPQIKSIGESAFENCSSLKSFIVPSAVQTIQHSAFKFSNLCRILVFSKFLKTIPKFCFFGCRYLNLISIPNTVTVLEDYSFKWSGI